MDEKFFKGVSEKGNFQEALTNAVNAALQDSPTKDDIVKWRLYDVIGTQGGKRGINMLTVKIAATFASQEQ